MFGSFNLAYNSVYLIQLLIIAVVYSIMASGLYWHTLLAVAVCACIGAFIHTTGDIVKRESVPVDPMVYVSYIIAAPFTSTADFAIVFCNYLKIKVICSRSWHTPLLVLVIVLYLGLLACDLAVGVNVFIYKRGKTPLDMIPSYSWYVSAELLMSGLMIYCCYQKKQKMGESDIVFPLFLTIDAILLKYRSALTRNKSSSATYTTEGRSRKNTGTTFNAQESVEQVNARATFTSTTQAALLESKERSDCIIYDGEKN
eukprot:Pgem_evm1s20314